MTTKITEFDGTLAIEPAIRFDPDHRVIPEPIQNLFFFPKGDINKALDLDPLLGQVYILDLIEQLKGGKEKMATLIIYPDKAKGCLIELGEERVILRESEKFVINYTDLEREPYCFEAKNHISAIRSFMGLFKVFSSPVDQKLLNSLGIKSLVRLSSGNGDWQVFPQDDDNYNARCRHLLTGYRELKDAKNNLIF